jgi:hypothetical protein
MFRGLVRDVDGCWTHGPKKRKKETWREAKFPLRIAMVPLKLIYVGYPRERISTGSGVPKAGFEPARVSPPPPQAAQPLTRRSDPFVYRIVTTMSKLHIP